ncbi:MAG: 50S ribosomal protein L21 [Epulopiscium sp. Nuni2H_MBin003]|nr:MAG: 50S ribosomal protein L21 [Epulopiscium sp. Nuni2H_MBin003]
MYAIIQTGGKQYKVEEGSIIKVEKLDVVAGDAISFDNVLAVSKDDTLTFGNPVINGAVVKAEVLEQGKEKKIIVFKYKPKKSYKRKKGHRQPFTRIKITSITA